MSDHYEILVVGSGEAGKYLAWTMAKEGHRTAVVERKLIGGSCPNIACLPSKNLIHSAKVASFAARAHEFGQQGAPLTTSMQGVLDRKRCMVDSLIRIHLDRYRATGVELIMGYARLTGDHTVQVDLNEGGSRVLTTDKLFLNLGTSAQIPEISGLSSADPMTNIEALDLDRLPQHLIVLGGGYIGLEMAQAFRRFGSQVTIVERGERILKAEDPDVGAAVSESFQAEGIAVLTGTTAERVEGLSGDTVRIEANGPQGLRMIEGTHLLVAAGRTPNTQGIGLELAGVECDSRGFIRVNEQLETTAANVWALGECAGSPMFTHAAFDDFRIVRDNLHGGKRTTRDRLVPSCMFTDPELARIGLNETEARRRGIAYRLARMPMAAVLRTRTISEPRGFMKMLIAAESDQILGFTAFGAEASELLAAVQTAMLGGLSYTVLRDAIYTHPTMAEGLVFLLANLETSA